MNTESQKPKFFGTKTDLKNTENSNALAPQGWIGQFSPQITQMITKKTIIIAETLTKTFFNFFVIFQSETCCKTTLVTRYFSGKVSCHAIEFFID